MDTPFLHITSRVVIPFEELAFTASRSSGPGGQHVNKVSTRVTLLFDLDRSPSLSEADKACLREALGGRIGKDGTLRVTSQTTRSQLANREIAVERFTALLRAALTPARPRKKTRQPLAAKRRRLEEKKQRAVLKRHRSGNVSAEE
jgi:ribosome-associated protein